MRGSPLFCARLWKKWTKSAKTARWLWGDMLPLKETVQKGNCHGTPEKGYGRIRDALDQYHGMAAHGRHPITQIGYKEDWVSVHRMKRMHHISRHKQSCKIRSCHSTAVLWALCPWFRCLLDGEQFKSLFKIVLNILAGEDTDSRVLSRYLSLLVKRVCCNKCICNRPSLNWSWKRDLNTRPADYESAALPAELFQQNTLTRFLLY